MLNQTIFLFKIFWFESLFYPYIKDIINIIENLNLKLNHFKSFVGMLNLMLIKPIFNFLLEDDFPKLILFLVCIFGIIFWHFIEMIIMDYKLTKKYDSEFKQNKLNRNGN